MKKSIYPIIKICFFFYLLALGLCLNAQSPGGIGTTNLQLWLKADAGVTVTSGVVSQWNDQSGKSRNHTQTVAGNRPAYINSTNQFLFNHQPTIRFNRASLNWMDSPNFSLAIGTNAMYVFVVSRLSAAAINGNYYATYGFNGSNLHTHWFNNTPAFFRAANYLATTKANVSYGVNSYILPSGTTVPRIIWNGTLSTFAAGTYTVANNTFAVGRDRDGSEYMDGDIAEVIIYTGTSANADIVPADLQKIQSYLSIKYGISLDPAGQADYISSAGTTYWNGSTNTGYQNNIIGLARDANTVLYQKQATSYPDSSISVYLGTLTTLNSSNSSTIATDNSFLMLGDNGLIGYDNTYVQTAPIVFQNASSTLSISNISKKIWKAQTTTIGSWTVNINTNKFPNAKYVLVSSSNSFTPATTDIYPVVAGKASNVVISNGKYVAIGSFSPTPGGVSTSLAFWAKADDAGVSPGSSMTSWKDISSNASDLNVNSGGTFTLQPGDANHNFQPWTTGYSATNYFYAACPGVAADFNGPGNPVTTSALTVFGAARVSTAAMGTITGIDNETNNAAEPSLGINVIAGTAYPYLFRYSNGINSTASGTTMQTTLNKSSIFFYQPPIGGGTGNLVFGLDGNQSTVASVNGTSTMYGPYLHIGYSAYNTGVFSGDIQEVIWYKSSLNAANLSKVNSYLAIKYGVTLTPGVASNYVNSAGTILWAGDAVYQKNMGGIGRDDFGALNQKQSKSVNANTNNQITIGLGTIATTNLLNANEFTKDLTSLVWGDNGATTSLATASTVFTYNGYSNNERMNRVWKISNTGTNALTQSVTIQIPTASVGSKTLAGEGPCAKYAIIFSTDPTFTSGVTSSILVTNGTNYQVTKKFPYGTTYFTFGKVNEIPAGSVYLPMANAKVTSTDICLKATGWKYYYADSTDKTQRAFAINWNGNTEPGSLNGVITYSTSPFVQFWGANVYQANIMGRLLEILPAGGSYTVNGGVKVKIFFDSVELENSIMHSPVSQKWFKFSGDAAATLAANNGQTIVGANFLTPAVAGEEDGYDYVQFDGIQSFSTFGFASNTGQGALPLKLESFTATGKGCNAILNWKTASEFNMQKFVIEQSVDGYVFTEAAIVAVANSSTGKVYQNIVPQSDERVFYRLKIVENNGEFYYSATQLVKTTCDGGNTLTIFPNPVGVAANLNLILSTKYRGNLQITITNAAGQSVLTKQVNIISSNNSVPVNIEKLAPGVYLLKFMGVNGVEVFKTQKIIK